MFHVFNLFIAFFALFFFIIFSFYSEVIFMNVWLMCLSILSFILGSTFIFIVVFIEFFIVLFSIFCWNFSPISLNYLCGFQLWPLLMCFIDCGSYFLIGSCYYFCNKFPNWWFFGWIKVSCLCCMDIFLGFFHHSE